MSERVVMVTNSGSRASQTAPLITVPLGSDYSTRKFTCQLRSAGSEGAMIVRVQCDKSRGMFYCIGHVLLINHSAVIISVTSSCTWCKVL